jgi:hypothetical protein
MPIDINMHKMAFSDGPFLSNSEVIAFVTLFSTEEPNFIANAAMTNTCNPQARYNPLWK